MYEQKRLNCVLHDGLGNRLFQIAALYAIATDTCRQFAILDLLPNAHSTRSYKHLYDQFIVITENNSHPVLREPEHLALTHSPDLIRQITDAPQPVTNVVGFFQSEKYFNNYKNDVRHHFREPLFVTEHIDKRYSNLDKAYFMHVRLGDYLTSKLHFVDLSKYYETCLDMIGPNHIILLFSNQASKIDEVYPRLKTRNNVVIVDESDELITLYLMARCGKGGICSNSSFSWWGSYLNKNDDKKVFMPRKWLNTETQNFQDIYYDGVTVVDV